MHFYQLWLRTCMPQSKKTCTTGDDHFTAAMTALLPENYCPCSPFSSSQTHGNQEAPNPEYPVGKAGQSSQDWICALCSSNWYEAWCYCVAREMLSSPLDGLWKFKPSAQWCSSLSWFVRVPGNPEGSPLSYFKRHCTCSYLLRAVSWTFSLMGNSHVTMPKTVILALDCSGDMMPLHPQWCDPGNFHFQPCTGSTGHNRIVCSVLSVPVWTSVEPTWLKHYDIPT